MRFGPLDRSSEAELQYPISSLFRTIQRRTQESVKRERSMQFARILRFNELSEFNLELYPLVFNILHDRI